MGSLERGGLESFKSQTALSKLVMELVMLCGSRRDIISTIRVYPWFVLVEKGLDAPAMDEMNLDSLIHKRLIELVGTRNLNLGGVAKLILARIAGAFRR
jgi:hypothetical protein